MAKIITPARPAAAPAKPAAAAPAKPAVAAPAKPAAAAPKPAAPAKPAGKPVLQPTAMQKRLKALRDVWNAAKEESKKPGMGGGTTLTVGKHICRLTDCKLNEGDKGPYVLFEFTCVDEADTEIGEKAVRFSGMDTEDRVVYLQRDLRKLGIDVDEFEIDQLEGVLTQLLEEAPTVQLQVKENEGSDGKMYTNVYVNKLVNLNGEEAPVEEVVGEEPAAEGEEAPAEETVEGEPEAEESQEVIEIGDDVRYIDPKGKPQTGMIKGVNEDGTAVMIRDDITKKVVTIGVDKIEKLATEPATDD